MRRTPALAVVLACAAVAAVGCGGSSSSKTVTVDAGSSLTNSFTMLGQQFEQAHPGVTIRFNFGGSDQLAAQITQGAPVDVFAAASPTTMATVTSAHDGIGQPTVFVRNRLEIAVPPSNPAHITTLAGTTKPGVKLDLCAPTVPCGAAATSVYTAANLTPHPVSLETAVAGVLTKVELGEVDAGVVYVTDVQGAGSKVHGVPFAESAQAISSYPIVVVKNGHNHSVAAQFEDYVLSTAGQQVLKTAGFLPPQS